MRRNALTNVLGCTALAATMVTVSTGSAVGAAPQGGCVPTWRQVDLSSAVYDPPDRYWYSIDHSHTPLMGAVSAVSGTDVRFAANQLQWRLGGGVVPSLQRWTGRTVDPAPQQLPVPPRIAYVDQVQVLRGAQSFSSPDEGWTVVTTTHGGQNHNVTYHWHDGQWTMVPTAVSPDPLTHGLEVQNVASVSTDDAWLVGNRYLTERGPFLQRDGVHIQRWDGTRWSIVDNPLATTTGARLYSLTALSADDVWAAGQRLDEAGTTVPLVMHWDGTEWRVVDVPTGNTPAALYDISGTGPDDIWAVGGQTRSSDSLAVPLAMHFNGTEWRVQELPDVGNSLYHAVYAASPTSVWAVGQFTTGSEAYFLHWDGRSWQRVRPPGSVTGVLLVDNYTDITGTGPNDVWAVGVHTDTSHVSFTAYRDTPLVAHLSCGRNR